MLGVQDAAGQGAAEISEILREAGLAPEPQDPWLHVGRTTRQQGWKIHVTASPNNLARLAQRLISAHAQEAFDFKIVATPYLAALMNEGAMGGTQIGKCATVYPADDEAFARLVDRLAKGGDLGGPEVPDDVSLGGGVFARFGGFNPKVERDPLGQMQLLIEDENGSMVPDDYDRELTHKRFVDRFAATPLIKRLQTSPDIVTALARSGYQVLGILSDNPKGRLFQALDMRQPGRVRPMILKEGRKGVLSGLDGLDIRDRLRHQFENQALAASAGLAARCDPCVDIGENSYLPIEFQSLDNLEVWVQAQLRSQTFETLSRDTRERILTLLRNLAAKIEALHDLGIVHRDLSPSNVLLADGPEPFLSDLEICWSANTPTVFGKGTPGFMAPEQAAGAKPEFSQDVHAFAALCLFALTGLDPRRLSRPDQQAEWRGLRRSFASLDPRAVDLIAAALSYAPEERPLLSDMAEALRLTPTSNPIPGHDAADLLHSGTATLSSPALLTGGDVGLWFSIPISGNQSDGLELRRSLNRGSAGPLFYCANYARHFDLPEDLTRAARANADWLIKDRGAADAGMPGLHFGEAGVLLALYTALDAGVVDFAEDQVAPLWRDAFGEGRFWTDVTHGHAGLVIACERLGELTRACGHQPPLDLDTRRHEMVAELIARQSAQGSWQAAQGVPGMSGETMTGFAHGVAGIGYSLASGQGDEALESALRAAEWLKRMSVPDASGAPSWHYSDANAASWTWWCHGAPGIALLFAALWRETGDPAHRDVALAIFRNVPERFNPANLSLCHGLAGLGSLMLDVAQLCDEPGLADKTLAMRDTILDRHFRGQHDHYWIVEDPELTSADLMVGISGVLHFLLRLETGDTALVFPGTRPIE